MTLLQNCNTNIELSFPINIRMKFLYTPLSQNCTFCMSNVHLDYEKKSHYNIYQIQNSEVCIVGYSSTYSKKTWLIPTQLSNLLLYRSKHFFQNESLFNSNFHRWDYSWRFPQIISYSASPHCVHPLLCYKVLSYLTTFQQNRAVYAEALTRSKRSKGSHFKKSVFW